AKWRRTTVPPNRLIGCYHAYRLLAEEHGLKEDMPYGHYRDAWMQLVLRRDRDTPAEHWTLLPGVEPQARDLFARAVADALSREALLEQGKRPQRQHTALDAENANAADHEAEAKAGARAAVPAPAPSAAARAQAA